MGAEPVMGQVDAGRIRQQIREDDEGKFEQRVARVLRLSSHRIIPHVWFDAASTECRDLFRDGHFYGCICLSQSVAEGLGKFILEVHHSTARNPKGKRLIRLLTNLKGGTYNGHPMSVLGDECLRAFTCIEGGDRNDFHHLNKNVITDLQELEKRAEACVMALCRIESELFGFEVSNAGILTPYRREYWPDAGKQYGQVYLRGY
jgi:hypothetical protein